MVGCVDAQAEPELTLLERRWKQTKPGLMLEFSGGFV